MEPKDLAEGCATCNGWVLSKNGKWVRTRSTVGLVCPDCGHDYGKEED